MIVLLPSFGGWPVKLHYYNVSSFMAPRCAIDSFRIKDHTSFLCTLFGVQKSLAYSPKRSMRIIFLVKPKGDMGECRLEQKLTFANFGTTRRLLV